MKEKEVAEKPGAVLTAITSVAGFCVLPNRDTGTSRVFIRYLLASQCQQV